MEPLQSSDELDAPGLVKIVFDTYRPLPTPRRLGTAIVGGRIWLVVFDASKGAKGFYAVPEDSESPNDRAWLTADQSASAMIGAGLYVPRFVAAARGSSATPDRPGQDEHGDVWDSLATDLGNILLARAGEAFELKVTSQTLDEDGNLSRKRTPQRIPISAEALATGLSNGHIPLRAACEAAPDALRGLFPLDRKLDTAAVQAVLARMSGTGEVAEKKPRQGL